MKVVFIFLLMLIAFTSLAGEINCPEGYSIVDGEYCVSNSSEVDFEQVNILGKLEGPTGAFITEVARPKFACDKFLYKNKRRKKVSKRWYRCMEKQYNLDDLIYKNLKCALNFGRKKINSAFRSSKYALRSTTEEEKDIVANIAGLFLYQTRLKKESYNDLLELLSTCRKTIHSTPRKAKGNLKKFKQHAVELFSYYGETSVNNSPEENIDKWFVIPRNNTNPEKYVFVSSFYRYLLSIDDFNTVCNTVGVRASVSNVALMSVLPIMGIIPVGFSAEVLGEKCRVNLKKYASVSVGLGVGLSLGVGSVGIVRQKDNPIAENDTPITFGNFRPRLEQIGTEKRRLDVELHHSVHFIFGGSAIAQDHFHRGSGWGKEVEFGIGAELGTFAEAKIPVLVLPLGWDREAIFELFIF